MAKQETFIRKEDLHEFKRLYLKSKREGNAEFAWEGQMVLRQFAKYVIQLMDSKFKE